MKGSLNISNHPARTLKWWYMRRNEIDMSPPYQRKGKLWSESDKAYLIDSVINGFDVPKLYLANFETRDSDLNVRRLKYAIIDGKQRFEAIIDFFENRVRLNRDFVWKKNPNLKLGGLAHKDLAGRYPELIEIFENESFDIMSVVTDLEEDINELFVRLNRSKPLTGAEVRNAMYGPVSEVTRTVANHGFFLENIKFSTKRAGDLNAAAKVVLFEYKGKETGTKKKDLDEFADDEEINIDRLELAGRRALSVLDAMQEVFLPKDPLLSSSGLFPVYYLLTKELKTSELIGLREFLVKFEDARIKNRELQKIPNGQVDSTLARFDVLNRSTNDLGSHRGRKEILLSSLRSRLYA